jgi:uncharacterized membrane protein HdeD (DUF308 family)
MAEYKQKFQAWPLLISGIIMAIIGLMCLLWPGLAYGVAGMMIGIGFIVTGFAFLWACFTPVIALAAPLLATYAVINFIVGFLFCINPVGSAVALVWIAFATMLIFAIMNLIAGITERAEGEKRIGSDRIVGSIAAIVLAILIMAFPNLAVRLLGLMALVGGIWLIYKAITAPRELVM